MNVLRFYFSLILLSVLFSTSVQAQTKEAPNAFAFRYVFNNYELPLKGIGFKDLDNFGHGLEFEYFRYLNNYLDLSIPFRMTSARIPTDNSGTAIQKAGTMGLDALLNFNIYKGKIFRPRLFAGVGGILEDLKEVSVDVPMGLGLNFRLSQGLFLSTTFAYHWSNKDLRDHVKVGVGFRLTLEESKEPEPVIKDRDGDGVFDAEDACPDVAGTAALKGCPDKDGDGITDASDKCPDTAGVAAFEGCPDTDSDGLMDSEDKCPNEAGPKDNEGCPITDRDGDGINDDQDNCPDDKGTLANNGCPDKSLVVFAKDKITNEVLPNTEVSLLNSSGAVVKTGVTNNLGRFEFANLSLGNYAIEGKLYDVVLDPAQVKESELKSSEPLQKTVYYNDPSFIVQGKVFYCNTTKPLPNVTLNLKNNGDNFMKSTISDENGQFVFHLTNRATYELYAKKESFLSQVVNVNTNTYDRSKTVFMRLEVCGDEVKCGEAIRLNNILYDTNKSFIREDAKPDLNKVVQFMKDNTDAKIELSSHSDSRGRSSGNLRLSDKRAQAAARYIVSQGVPASKVISKGYGESRLLNRCADGVKCSDAEHQANRRTEFKVICPK